METPNQESKSKKGTLWLILLLLSVVLNIYQWRNHSTSVNMYEQKVDTLVVERVNVEKELSETRAELEKYRGISANLDSLLNEAQAKIDEQSKKINSITRNEKNLKALNEQLRQQLADLQILRDEYLGRIDSLLMVNKQLVAEKEQLTGQNITLSKNLETTVATASVLKAEYIKAKSFKRKSSGKYVETALAKRTHKLDICFDILDNKIAKQGEKNRLPEDYRAGRKTDRQQKHGIQFIHLCFRGRDYVRLFFKHYIHRSKAKPLYELRRTGR